MADADFYPQWDNCTLNYDLTKYNFPTLVLHVVKEIFPQVDALETIHKHLTPSQVVDLCDHVQKSFGRKHFMQLFDEFAEQYIKPKLNGKRYLIKRNPTPKIRTNTINVFCKYKVPKIKVTNINVAGNLCNMLL